MPLRRSLHLLLRRVVQDASISLVLVGVCSGVAAAAPLVRFEWSATSTAVDPEATEVLVDLIAQQDDGADASFFTIGFGPSGIVTDVALAGFGSLVSAPDSFFGVAGGTLTLIASAPASPGSFGPDTDLIVATLRLLLDTNLGGAGALALLDLTATAGAPALMANGTTAIPSQFAAPFEVTVVPEPGTALLLLVGCLFLAARARRRSA